MYAKPFREHHIVLLYLAKKLVCANYPLTLGICSHFHKQREHKTHYSNLCHSILFNVNVGMDNAYRGKDNGAISHNGCVIIRFA